jgi:hypothetical protein
MLREIAPNYIRSNFRPTDRLAVVLVNSQTDSVIQRIATADKIAAPDFQAWLRHQNAQRYEVYISMNTLRSGARGRTKEEIAAIRHVYLDIDKNGDKALQAIFRREDLPVPSFTVNTSPNKWQVIWKVEDFDKDQAEELQRALARDTGADRAATDYTRVLRLPGFYNHKYDRPYVIRLEPHAMPSAGVYRPEHFPKYPQVGRHEPALNRPSQKHVVGALSQSERDWAFAKRALARGEPEDMVIAAIANYRRYDKHNPEYYADLTVRKAAQALKEQPSQERTPGIEPDR